MPIFHLDLNLTDFDTWLPVFKGAEDRKALAAKHGISTRRVARDRDNPNHVIVMLEADSPDSVKNFLGEPQIQERFADRSIFAKTPSLGGSYEGSDLEEFTDGENPAFFVDHQLVDFDKWREAFSANQLQPNEAKSELGIKHVRLLRDIEDGNHAIVISVAPDRAAMDKLLAGPRAQEQFAKTDIFKRAPEITGQFSPVDV